MPCTLVSYWLVPHGLMFAPVNLQLLSLPNTLLSWHQTH